MIGILLLTHGTLGESLIQCVCHVLNRRPPALIQLGIAAQDDPLDMLPIAKRAIKEVDQGRGVIVLSDIFGATPCNIGLKLLQPGYVEGVAGVNLPMLLRVLTYREGELNALIAKAITGGCDGVIKMKLT